ncbi:hypothetical protein [Streptomyces sp. NPDC015125]|uniref:hypothetical protein n=1 Tax=Streptomyces sp. NPDC015125 TaxID=3364938 RepID=UPI0036F9A651
MTCVDQFGRDDGLPELSEQALTFSRLAAFARPVLINGAPGLVTARGGRPCSVMGFTVAHGKIVETNILADPARLSRLELTILDDCRLPTADWRLATGDWRLATGDAATSSSLSPALF